MTEISIITPVFNRQHLIGRAILSVINQSYQNWEMLIIDDGSTDATVPIIKMYTNQDRRVKLIERNRPPKGAATCRNIGIAKAKGEFIIFLDSDDELLPYSLEQRVNAATQLKEYDFLVFQTIKKNKETGEHLGYWSDFSQQSDHYYDFLKLKSPWQTAGPLWRLSSLLKHNLRFDENLKIWQDVDFHLQALYKGLKYKLMTQYPEDVVYLVHEQTISQKAYTKAQRKSQIYFLHKHCLMNKDDNKARKILLGHINTLIKKNKQQRFYDNALKLWRLKKKKFCRL